MLEATGVVLPAIDCQNLARNEVRSFAEQEDRGIRDVCLITPALERNRRPLSKI